ncbi:Tol-Pal system protein TolB [Candidatus Bealeia paramacronuclearis]|uniref:Tol-Pal system protein TolB n=1 Tax=Candidatus Bealeia paramacronuclearis TaxID=1921001 RepID=A0ABZ2C4W5_9PROT|nr:Tol-Pal system protein TolB [Candidatus Bealeia paramacronuclearis]
MKKFLLAFSVLFVSLSSLKAELTIDITEGGRAPVPIAITDFSKGSDPSLANVASQISEVVSADLARSGLFKLVNPQAYIQTSDQVMQQPDFGGWKVINTEALVGGSLKKEGGQMRVDFRLFDVYTQSQLAGLSLASDQNNWRRLAHKIADTIYERITGDKGYFDTRIVYIHQKGRSKDVQYRLAIMDQDGENHQFLTSGQSIVLTPRFSPDGKQVVYLDYGKDNKKPNLYLFDLQTGKNQSLGSFPGLKMSPRFAPDGKTLLLSVADKGVTSLYSMDLSNRKISRLTKSTGSIDVSPCYSPDGSQIVFTSDRGGKPKLYLMNAGGSEPQRISFGEGLYFTPVWSPRGDLIAFTKQVPGGFYVGVMRPDGSGERMLAQDYLVEGPTWSPNGRVLLYTRQSHNRAPVKLFAVDVTGFNEYEVATPGDATYGSWSPLID